MTRLSDKQIVTQGFGNAQSMPSDFNKPEVEATLRDKGVKVFFEKAYQCPCTAKSQSAALTVCKNCGGTGWFFANPTDTRFIITSLSSDGKLKEAALREFGLMELGVVNVTALNDNKLSYMDKLTFKDSTSEHNQILYPALSDDETQIFVYTQYDILSIDNITLFVDQDTKLKRLEEETDYLFSDNIIIFTEDSGVDINSQIAIRYVHHPVFHIIDIVRDSFTSKTGQRPQGQNTLILPVKALAKRAHLIKDVENLNGDRLFDNSWLPNACEAEQLSAFQRQLKYASVDTIYSNLTAIQIAGLQDLICGSAPSTSFDYQLDFNFTT